MAEFKLGRIRFVYQGAWATGTSYVVDDVVTVNGKTYICVVSHTASALFSTDQTYNPTKWNLVSDGTKWRGDWAGSTHYDLGDQVQYGGTVYICKTAHTSATYISPTWLGLENDQSKWDAFATTIAWKGAWTNTTRYKVRDLVTYGGITYLCNEKHISASSDASGLENDLSKWDVFNAGIIYKGDWSGSSIRYKLNDVVKYGADLWICTANHSSSSTFDDTKFSIFVSGLQFENSWSVGTAYQIGDIVTYGGNVYTAKQNHTGQTPSTATAYWAPFTTGFNYSGDWSSGTSYKVGDVARLGGYTYLATADGANHVPPNTSYWQRLNSGFRWNATAGSYTGLSGTNVSSSGSSATFDVTSNGTAYTVVKNAGGSTYAINDTIKILGTQVGGLSPANDILITVTGVSSGAITTVSSTGSAVTWASGIAYVLGDVVFFGANSYTCVSAHVASSGNRPDADTTATYWNVLAAGAESASLTTTGDMFYYGANGPTRLPIGTDGQVLRVNNNVPEWSYYGLINNVVYVAPSGTDSASDGAGLTIDKPWKTIQYACQQIEAGYLNQQAQLLLAKNKQFIIKEVNNYVQYTYPGVCDPTKTERDAGIVLDAVIYDLGHGGNLNTTTATLAYYNEAGTDYINSTVSSQIAEFVAGQTYMQTLLADILANTAPGTNYQTLNSVATPAEQIIDTTLTAEETASTTVDTLLDIVITGIAAGSTRTIATATVPATTIRLMTGTYNEHLPIVLPRNTAIVGDELRSSVVQPASAVTNLVNDKAKSVSALERIKAIIPDLIDNVTITPTTGNTETQVTTLPAGSVGSPEAVASVVDNVGLIQDILSNGLAEVPAFVLPTPTGYNTSLTNTAYAATGYATGSTANFGYGKAQLVANYTYIKAEIAAYITVNGSYGSYSAAYQAKTTRDVGYILDAIQYDMTYGGNRQTLIAGRAYYSNNILQLGSTYLTDTLTALARLKTVVGQIILETNVTESSGNTETQDTSGTPGSAACAAFAQDRVQDVIDWINNGTANATVEPYMGWTSSALQTAFDAVQAARAEIQSDTVVWVQKYFQSTSFDTALTSRDAGDIVDALSYDLVFGSNFNSITAGRRYNSPVTSALVVVNTLLEETRRSIAFIGWKVKQYAASGAATQIQTTIDDVIAFIHGGKVPRTVWPDYTGVDAENAAAAKLIWKNKAFIEAELIEYINTTYPSIEYSEYACKRDVGYIVDAIRYDLTYGGNFATRQAAVAYYSQLTSALQIDAADKTATLAAYAVLKTIVQDIANGGLSSYSATQSEVSYISGTGGDSTSSTTVGTLVQDMIDYIDDPVANPITETLPSTSWVDSTLTSANSTLQSARTAIRADIITFINTNFPALVYDDTTCSRDVGYIIDAVGYDLMFGSNFRSIKSGLSYYQAQASLVVGSQKEATLAAFNYLKTKIESYLTNATALARASANMQIVIDILNYGSGKSPEVNGTITYNNTLDIINGAEILRANKTFLAYEASAWTTTNFSGTVTTTTATTNLITTSASHHLTVGDPVHVVATPIATTLSAVSSTGNWITLGTTTGVLPNMRIIFTGVQVGNVVPGTTYWVNTVGTGGNAGKVTITSTYGSGVAFNPGSASGSMLVTVGGAFGGLATTQGLNDDIVVYYVLTVPSTTTLTITATQGGTTPVTLTTANGLATIKYYYSEASCLRDTSAYIDALVYDLQFTGNYRSLRAAKLYNNAVKGSQAENMFLVRNGSGLRNMTWTGLRGTLSNENSYGTKRPTAGAYASLDEGFGPNDQNVWINSRSCYTQNITMFGNACSGGKVDGALHAGGYKSMVANDFTAIISDGIGYWVTGSNAVAELVSVFNYYGYAGYMAELGGKIRATNGNSSYGTYGVVAEGVDTYEAPINGTLNNRASQALVGTVITDAVNQVLRFEYANAGSGYSNSVASISGSGYNAVATHDEFRDGAVFETRLIDRDDGQGSGGSNYSTSTNVAQTGAVGEITIAATDIALSTAYVGMRIQLVAGTGVGQYANILDYNNGTKVAKIIKDSFTTLTVTATTAGGNNLLTVASTATLYVGMPIYLASDIGGLTANTVYYVIAANFSATQFAVSTSSGGSAAPTTVTSGQTVSLYAAGWDHVISGHDGDDILDLTSGYIIEPRISYTAPGYTATARTIGTTSATWKAAAFGAGKYVAIANGSTTTAYSLDGVTWTTGGAQPSSQQWSAVQYVGGQGASATAVIGGLGGAGAVLTPILGTGTSATQIIGVTVTAGGYGYDTAPIITFSGGGGSGATARALVLNGSIEEIVMDINGSGYTSLPTVTANTSRLTDISVVNWGQDYYSTPSVSVAAPFVGASWAATTSVSLNAYIYTVDGNYYKVTVAGTTGSSKPTHTTGTATNGGVTFLYVGKQATATAVMTNAGVSGYTITEEGDGYSAVPAVTITDSSSRFISISNASNNSSYQTPTNLGATWTAGGSTGKTNLKSIAYGGGLLIAVGGASGTASAVSSTDGGATWVDRSSNITALGATSYSSIAYGNGTFVAIQTGGVQTSWCTGNPASWTSGGNLPSSTTWTSITYGNGRFVALADTGAVAYSIDKGVTWTASPTCSGTTTSILSSSYTWTKVKYGQGVFLAIANGSVWATSPDGITWTTRSAPSSSNWEGVAFGSVSATPRWAVVSNTSGTVGASVRTGAQALGRMKAASGTITEIRMIEPGSGYPKGTVTATTVTTNVITTSDTTNLVDSQPIEFTGLDSYGLTTNVTYYVIGSTIVANTSFKVSATAGSSTAVLLTTGTGLSGTYRAGPIATQTDPNKVYVAGTRVRMGDGALGNPSFGNRGANNATATATTLGDGYGDVYQNTAYINVSNLYSIPAAGSNVEFASIPSTWYKLVSVTNILGDAGNYTAQFQVNPALSTLLAPAHNNTITTKLKYSQVRLTGHDFLYVGSGNQTDTNYPYVDTTSAIQSNQELAVGGGRVFFTSTDQDGNFNVGNLFGVQQATGTATLNASAFNLAGLQSLQLGAVTLGVGSAIITQFSTDPYFTANSDSIVPTQKAIKAFITAQIGGGASSLNVNTITSGQIYIANNTISNTTGAEILVTSKMTFTGGIDGAPVALVYFGQR